MENLVSVFLAVIALSALLQAGFVIALAIAARKAAHALDTLEARLATDLPRQVQTVTKLTERIALLADAAILHTERAGDVLEEAEAKVERALVRVTTLVERASARAETDPEGGHDDGDTLEADDDIGPLPGRLGHAYALFKGVRRALAAWREGGLQESAPPSSPN